MFANQALADTPNPADTAAKPEEQTSVQPAASPPKKFCHMQYDTGSIMPKRICTISKGKPEPDAKTGEAKRSIPENQANSQVGDSGLQK
jgi:hypothetical protein